MFESNDAVASVFPEGDHAIARTVFVCPVGMVVMCENLTDGESDMSESIVCLYPYNLTFLSAEHEARMGFVGFHAICHARSSWPGIF